MRPGSCTRAKICLVAVGEPCIQPSVSTRVNGIDAGASLRDRTLKCRVGHCSTGCRTPCCLTCSHLIGSVCAQYNNTQQRFDGRFEAMVLGRHRFSLTCSPPEGRLNGEPDARAVRCPCSNTLRRISIVLGNSLVSSILMRHVQAGRRSGCWREELIALRPRHFP